MDAYGRLRHRFKYILDTKHLNGGRVAKALSSAAVERETTAIYGSIFIIFSVRQTCCTQICNYFLTVISKKTLGRNALCEVFTAHTRIKSSRTIDVATPVMRTPSALC